jgi:hypothetical protein
MVKAFILSRVHATRTVATLKEHAFFEEIEDWRFAWGSQIISDHLSKWVQLQYITVQ